MSYLSRPRVNFFSTDAMTNPSTANNENVIHLLDYDNVELLNPPVVKGATLAEMSPAAYRQWMTSLVVYSDPFNEVNPFDPNARADWQQGMPGYWNYWGDHLSTFGDARVTTACLEHGDPAGDPLLGASVTFRSRIVDVNPADTFCSQFVASGFSVIGPDSDGNPAELIAGVPTTSMTRFLNFFRWMGAGTFQAVIANDRLSFIDEARAPASAALHALRAGASSGGGLLLRWCYYGMKTARNQNQMYDAFQQGEMATNPKVGRVVGSLGVWNGDDMISTPVGRYLQQPGPPFFASTEATSVRQTPRVKSHKDVEKVSTRGLAAPSGAAETPSPAEAPAPAPPPPNPAVGNMGVAVAVVDGNRVVLDLNTAFPEGGKPPPLPEPWPKVDAGVVNLELVYDAGQGTTTTVLGPVRYDGRTYEQEGGVAEVPFDPASEAGKHIRSGSLRLVVEHGPVLLQESDVPLVLTDDQAVYLDLPSTGVARGRAQLRVFEKGEPIQEPVTVTVEQWNDVQVPGEVNSLDPLVMTATSLSEVASWSSTVQVPTGGRVDVPLTADRPGCYKLRYLPPGMHVGPQDAAPPVPVDPDGPPPQAPPPNWAVEFFSTFRVLPYDDYSNVADADITFEYVYKEVLNYFAILFPIMSTIIPWGPDNTPLDPERVAQFAALIRQATDESRIGTALEMPITRDLSAGKRALLHRWCDLQLQDGG